MIEYDDKMLKKMFGKPVLPKIPLGLKDISTQAQKLAGKLSISGVQPKLSVSLKDYELISVEEHGQYILKPQTQEFPLLPENEYLCMQLAKLFGIKTADFIMMELSDKTKAYLVKRFDRRKKGSSLEKLACEDMQQILGGRSKYEGSHEQIAKVIRDNCEFAPLQLQILFELALFNFAIGNGDAHKKNFSLLTAGDKPVLSPAYDLVSSRLVIPDEDEEFALSLNGRKNKLSRNDFLTFADHLDISPAFADKTITKLISLRNDFIETIRISYLAEPLKERFVEILTSRLERLI